MKSLIYLAKIDWTLSIENKTTGFMFWKVILALV